MIAPITGTPFYYRVPSATNPGQFHIADVLDDTCSCPSWVCRQRKHREQTGQPYRCRHIKEAREFCLEQCLDAAREQLLAK